MDGSNKKRDEQQAVAVINEQEIVLALAESLESGNKASFNEAFSSLVKTYGTNEGMLMRKLLALLRDVELAKDALQVALFSAYQSLQGFTPERIRKMHLKAWLYTIIINQARKDRRQSARIPVHVSIQSDRVDEELLERLEVPFHERPESVLEAVEMNECMLEAIHALPKIYQKTAFLYFFEGRNQAEIAAELQQPLNTVKSHILRSKPLLRAAFVDQEG